jgi:hypothetical protein
MEIIEAFAKIISEHGYATVFTALFLGTMVWKGKSILSWLADTYNAAQVVKLHQETIIELKKEIELMREQLEENNRVIMQQVEEIAVLRTRLERYEHHFTKSTARKSRSKMNDQ